MRSNYRTIIRSPLMKGRMRNKVVLDRPSSGGDKQSMGITPMCLLSYPQNIRHQHSQPPAAFSPCCKAVTCFRSSRKKSFPLAIVLAGRNRQRQAPKARRKGSTGPRTLRAPRPSAVIVHIFSRWFINERSRFFIRNEVLASRCRCVRLPALIFGHTS